MPPVAAQGRRSKSWRVRHSLHLPGSLDDWKIVLRGVQKEFHRVAQRLLQQASVLKSVIRVSESRTLRVRSRICAVSGFLATGEVNKESDENQNGVSVAEDISGISSPMPTRPKRTANT